MIPSKDESERRWAYRENGRADVPASPEEAPADEAWRWLLIEHMPFHALDDKERNRIVDQLASLENEIYKSRGERGSDAPVDEGLHDWSGIETRILSTEGDGRRLLARQARLMEQAFILLRLDRYANAPVNRGLMNLFRAWSSSRAFNEVLEQSRTVFSKPFLAFHAFYIRGQPSIDKRPIPHPWDREVVRAQTAAAQELSTAEHDVGLERSMVTGFPWQLTRSYAGVSTDKPVEDFRIEGPGIYLDSGIIEADRDEPSQLSASQKDEPTKAKEELPNA